MQSTETVFVLAALGLIPLLFMGLTAFVKISTVLLLTRSAIGLPSVPANLVVLVLASALTLVAMTPLGRVLHTRLEPLTAELDARSPWELLPQALEVVSDPLKDFYLANASPRELERFTELARKQTNPKDQVDHRSFGIAVPAFLVTELLRAFAVGFAIFLPFLVLDLIVANVLVALGVSAVNPAQLALPLKLLLFVAVDGWGLLAEALVTGYVTG